MTLLIESTGAPCGAVVGGLDLADEMSAALVEELRAAWLQYHVLVFPDQVLSDDDLERFTLHFGAFGQDPFIAPIEGREHVIAIRRDADETAPVFAEAWHSDWSFQERPPAGTCLYGITIPPVGGQTLFANQHLALEEMPPSLRTRIEGKMGVHSARAGYAPTGLYGDADKDSDRSMEIRISEDALAEQPHPLIRPHPETGRLGIFGTLGYIVAIEGMDKKASDALLLELYRWQSQERFVYSHSWREKMLVMWDNRSVLHKASAGYDGYARLLHRTTIGAAC